MNKKREVQVSDNGKEVPKEAKNNNAKVETQRLKKYVDRDIKDKNKDG